MRVKARLGFDRGGGAHHRRRTAFQFGTPRSRVRVKRRRRVPLRQGDLDGLCGVYAIINALRHLCPELSPARSQALFRMLVRSIAPRAPERAIAKFSDGLTIGAVFRLARLAAAYTERHHNGSISVSLLATRRHRGGARRWPLARYWRELATVLAGRSAVIVGLNGSQRHWSVAISISSQQLQLLDSDGLHLLRRSRCTTAWSQSKVTLSHVTSIVVTTETCSEAL